MTDVAEQVHAPELPSVRAMLDDRFEILAVLGEGGMGHVFRVQDHARGREVALKLIIPRYLGRPERELRFLRELELSERVGRHPNLVRITEGGRLERDGWPYLVMDLVGPRDLGSRLALGALPPQEAAHVARQVAGALQALHRVDVVHRDVNAMNVMMRGDHAVLIDLSHAGDAAAPRVPAGRAGRLTGPNEVPGTHHYMPPEQAWAAPPEPPMDVYAFGVTLVHMLTGHAPRGCGREAFLELARAGKISPPRVDIRVHQQVPAELAELAHACTATKPSERPTIGQVVERLDEILASRGAETRELAEPSDAEPTEPASAPPTATSAEEYEAVEPLQWGRLLAVAMAVVLVVGLVVALVWKPAPVDAEPIERETSQPGQVESPNRESDDPRTLPTGNDEPVVSTEKPAPSGSEVEHPTTEPEPVEEDPDPALVPAENTVDDEPSKAPRARRTERTKPKPAADLPSSEECRERRAAADAATSRKDWAEVLEQTAKPKCWASPESRRMLRVRALQQLGRNEACVRAAKGSDDTMVLRLARLCEAALSTP